MDFDHAFAMNWLNSLPIQTWDDKFQWACKEGNLDFVQCIYELSQSQLTENDILKGFEKACYFGKLEIVQWLYFTCKLQLETSNMDIKNIFLDTCFYNQVEIAKWIYTTFQLSLNFAHFAFDKCMARGFKTRPWSVIQWLQSLSSEEWKAPGYTLL